MMTRDGDAHFPPKYGGCGTRAEAVLMITKLLEDRTRGHRTGETEQDVREYEDINPHYSFKFFDKIHLQTIKIWPLRINKLL